MNLKTVHFLQSATVYFLFFITEIIFFSLLRYLESLIALEKIQKPIKI